MTLTDSFLISYLKRLDNSCFTVTLHGKTWLIGKGEPQFSVTFRNSISQKTSDFHDARSQRSPYAGRSDH